MNGNREWMYKRFSSVGGLNIEFQDGLESFIEFASAQFLFADGEKIKCPCKKCKNIPYHKKDTVRYHLSKFGFVPNYHTWTCQGETTTSRDNVVDSDVSRQPNTYHTHLDDSRSAFEYAKEIARDRGVDIADVQCDVFQSYHATDDGSYTDGKARSITRQVEEHVTQLSQSGSNDEATPEIDRTQILKNVIGSSSKKKNMMFGAGSLSRIYMQSEASSHSVESAQPADYISYHQKLLEMEARLQAEREQYEARLIAEQQQQREAYETRMQAEREQYEARLQAEMRARDDVQAQFQAQLRAQQEVLERFMASSRFPPPS